MRPDPERLMRHWRVLCEEIGERRAGTAGEDRAVDYLLEQFRALDLTPVTSESFACTAVESSEADVRLGELQVPARVLAGSPATDGQVTGDLVWVEMPEQAGRLVRSEVEGKVVVLVGPLPTVARLHRRLVACAPAAVLHADDRLPFDWPKDDGVYPLWVKRYGMPPTAAIPFRLAWEAKQQGASRAEVRLSVVARKSRSHNVIAEIPGQRFDLPVILLGAHHDTQCHNAGADDNASGVVALLELAALLAESRPLRTIRLVSFGAEEQLSVGSAAYVRRHLKRLGEIAMVFNFDSISSPLGHRYLIRAGSHAFGQWMVKALAKAGLPVSERAQPMPFADHFPFSVYGIPAVTLMRPNMDSGMRWQHHSEHDHLGNVSLEVLSETVAAAATVIATAARAHGQFERGLPPEQRAETRRLARELYGITAP